MHDDTRVWIDFGLLLAFPGTVLTGLMQGHGGLPGYWHVGMALFLIVLVFLHLLFNERGLMRSMKRLRELVYGLDGEDGSARFEERDEEDADEQDDA